MKCCKCGSPDVSHVIEFSRNSYCCWCWVAGGGAVREDHPFCRMARKKQQADRPPDMRGLTEQLAQLRQYIDAYENEERQGRAVRGNERIEIIGPADQPHEWWVAPPDPEPIAPIQYRPQHGWLQDRDGINIRPGGANRRYDGPYNYPQRFEPYVAPRAKVRGQRVGDIPPLRRNPGGVPMRNEVQQPREAPQDAERVERRHDGGGNHRFVVDEMARIEYRHKDWQDIGPMGLRYRQQEVDPGGQPAGGPGAVQPDGVGE